MVCTHRLSAVLTGLLVALAMVFVSRSATAAPTRFAILVGNNRGSGSDVELRYAESDVQKVDAALRDLGAFPPENVVVLRGETVDAVRRAIATTADRMRVAAQTPGSETFLFVFYSGHADADALHLGGSSLPVAELQQLVSAAPATFRLLAVDACRSGTLTRVKGGKPAPSFDIRADERMPGEGLVVLTASSASEDAQESDELKGSFFTHYFVSALRGAADGDGDGAVSLEEAYRYSYDATIRATSRTFAGTQHPTFRYDMRGQGRLVLTFLARSARRAVLSFPAGKNYLVFKGSRQGDVVGEVSEASTSRSLSVDPGTYFVRARGRDAMLEGEVAVAAGAQRPVEDRELSRIEYARLVRKGEGEARLSHGPFAAYAGHTSLSNGSTFCHGALAGYRMDFRALSLEARVAGCRSGYENAYVSATSDEGYAELRAGRSFDLPIVTMQLSVGAGGGALVQHFTTDERARAPSRTTGMGRLAVALGLSADLALGAYVFAEGGAATYFYGVESSNDRTTRLARDVTLAVAGGLGWRF
jgi:hypothetical protein